MLTISRGIITGGNADNGCLGQVNLTVKATLRLDKMGKGAGKKANNPQKPHNRDRVLINCLFL